MKFNTYCLWLCVVLFVNQVTSDELKTIVDEFVFPAANIILPALSIPPPAGPIIASGVGFMQLCSQLFFSSNFGNPVKENKKPVEKPITKVNLMEVQKAIRDQLKDLDTHLLQESEKIIQELTMSIADLGIFAEMQQTVDYLQQTYTDRMKSIINPKITGIQKRLTIQDMLSYSSDYRNKLRSFITKFIKSKNNGIMLLKRNSLFFEHVLERENLLAAKNEDCNSDSFYNKVYESFMYILKVLTDGYVMVVSAHFVKYQEELQVGTLSEAEELRENALIVMNDYKNDIKILIETTKWALGNASREIRNCGKFQLEEGKTFERISFSHTIPKILYLEYVDIFKSKCVSDERYVKTTNYEIGACSAKTDDIPIGSELTLSVNLLKNSAYKGPYCNMKIKTVNGTEATFGRDDGAMPFLHTFRTYPQCFTTFCTAFKEQSYAISTQRVSAEPGNVITGLRFRMKNKVIYIDIQQGKFIDILTVDPKTVFWKETPENDQIVYLGMNLRQIELGEFVLKNNSILTSIQLRNSIFRKGLLQVSIGGSTPPFLNNTNFLRYENDDLEINELQLVNADDPVMISHNSNNLISKAPVAGKRYFVSFQPSDFKKDFGQATVPLLDIREVVSNPPTPLNGMGFYHETVTGSGGLIAIKLITPNMIDLLNTTQEI